MQLLLEQNKEKKSKSNVPEVPASPCSEPMTPNPLTHNVMQDQQNQLEQHQNLLAQVPNDPSMEMDQHGMPQPSPGPFTGFPQVPHSPQFQQDQPRCVTPLTPMSLSGATPPMTPTSYTPTSPMGMFATPRMNALPGGKGGKTAKSKKTKEDKEKDKEKRKQKLLVQQQQEREWKLLQQRRQLEQQRQQQQSQQETNLLRQEVKRTQQVKGLRALDDKKKKSPQKIGSKQSLTEFGCGGKSDSQDSYNSVDTPQQSPSVSMHSDDSFSLMSAPSLDTLDSGHVIDHIRDRRNSLPNLAMSQHGLENVRPLSPINTTQDRAFVRSLSQPPSHSPWNDWNNDASKHDQDSPMWSNSMQQPQPMNEQNKDNFSNPIVARQNSCPPTNDETFMLQQNEHHLPEGTVDLPFQPDQSWKANDSQGPPMTPGVPKQVNDPVQMPPQDHHQGDMVNMPFHQQSVVNDQQSHVLKQQDVPPQWHPEMHSNHPQPGPQDHMGMVQQNVPQQQQPHLMPQNQGQPRLQHPDMSRQPSYEFQAWQDTSSGPTSLTFQQPQMQQAPHQQQAPMPHVPQSIPIQPMVSINSTMQQQSQPGMSQVPIQPGPPPPPPPPPLTPQQHGTSLPMSRQPPADEQQQQQQLEMLQKQQREQLMRAQQQQFLQMQLQQQQHLLQQQQQQQQPPQQPPLAAQPPFARTRMNQVINTKDMPEIESEEEHQERLRFLYRQRQIQKQHIQMQAQQTMFQQQWPAQGVMPSLMPTEPGNPQGMPPIRPQPAPEMMQQQLFIEYQRRMNQRHELGQQTLQFDKVVQDLQQQQGAPPPGPHPTPPFMEVSHQRFALRHPNPGMPANQMGPIGPGQVPVFGVDGQQLYRMQMQQQVIMQQQPPQRVLLQKPKVLPNTTPKESLPDPSGNKGQSSSKLSETDKKSDEASENNKVDSVKPTEEHSAKSSEISTTVPVNEKETDKTETKNDTANDIAVTDQKELETSKQQVTTDSEGTIPKLSEEVRSVDSTLEGNFAENNNTADNTDKDTSKSDNHADSSAESRNDKETSDTPAEVKNPDESAKVDNTTKPPTSSEEKSQQKNTVEENIVPVSVIQPTMKQKSINTRPRPQEPAASQQMQPPTLSAPHTPSLAPSSNQQALHQQLMATQQRFFQMQQQRQIMMQQYQQLQQQLQQNQGDPMIGAQLMALQQQGQFLQQNMLQVWQQMQMLQQQVQSSGGLPPQQMIQQNPMQGVSPGQGQQWQGPMQDPQLGMLPQHPAMMSKPGIIPQLPGQLIKDGAPTPKTVCAHV